MKNLIYLLPGLLVVLSITQGCKKLDDNSPQNIQTIQGKRTLKINQPDSISLDGIVNPSSVKWSVTPTGFNTESTVNGIAIFVFSKSGAYTIKGTAEGGKTLAATVTVSDSVYVPQYTTYPFTGDQILLTPYLHEDKQADTAYIYFTATTVNSYCNSSRLDISSYVDVNNNFTMGFLDIVEPDVCTTGEGPVSVNVNYTQNPARALENGTYPLSVTLNGMTYTGNIVVTSASISFDWNYTSGVTISPKQISR
ncbi:MAG TPA: hypothetical protein VHC47_06825 [Mucilaginibacter sp.]|nr:hypothetical protein [Mucilaginibacter sp.]